MHRLRWKEIYSRSNFFFRRPTSVTMTSVWLPSLAVLPGLMYHVPRGSLITKRRFHPTPVRVFSATKASLNHTLFQPSTTHKPLLTRNHTQASPNPQLHRILTQLRHSSYPQKRALDPRNSRSLIYRVKCPTVQRVFPMEQTTLVSCVLLLMSASAK